MTKPITNMVASVHARLLNRAKADVAQQIHDFVMPVVDALVGGAAFTDHWSPGGPWVTPDDSTQ